MEHVKIVGLMGMATLTEDKQKIASEFAYLKEKMDEFSKDFPQLTTLSMGMSGDYQLAIDNGSNMVRIGSSIFGKRIYN